MGQKGSKSGKGHSATPTAHTVRKVKEAVEPTVDPAKLDDETKAALAALEARVKHATRPSEKAGPPEELVVEVFVKDPLPNDPSVSQCLLELNTPALNESQGERAPLELCIVLDRSGSMAGAKHAQAREAINLVVRSSGPRDIIHLVAYDSSADVIFESGSAKAAKALAETIRGVKAQGGTNINSGLSLGMKLLTQSTAGFPQRIFLFSDGQDGGTTRGEALLTKVRGWQSEGVNISCFGIGTDFDEPTMRAIAEAGAGGFVYICNSAEIPDKVAKGLGALQSLFCKNMTLQIEMGPGCEIFNSYAYSGFSKGVRLGDMSALDRKQVLLELKVTPKECQDSGNEQAGADAPGGPVVDDVVGPEGGASTGVEKNIRTVCAFKWTLTYEDVATGKDCERTGEAFLNLTSDEALLAAASEHPSVVFSAVVAECADRDQVILDLLDRGSDHMDKAISVKKHTIASLEMVEHLDPGPSISWLLARAKATLSGMEARGDYEKMRKDVGYERYQASGGLQCAGLI